MAIDGVKIIDSDDAYDIYNDIVERYKDGIDVELIKKDWLNEESNFCTDELYTEIYFANCSKEVSYMIPYILFITLAINQVLPNQ